MRPRLMERSEHKSEAEFDPWQKHDKPQCLALGTQSACKAISRKDAFVIYYRHGRNKENQSCPIPSLVSSRLLHQVSQDSIQRWENQKRGRITLSRNCFALWYGGRKDRCAHWPCTSDPECTSQDCSRQSNSNLKKCEHETALQKIQVVEKPLLGWGDILRWILRAQRRLRAYSWGHREIHPGAIRRTIIIQNTSPDPWGRGKQNTWHFSHTKFIN